MVQLEAIYAYGPSTTQLGRQSAPLAYLFITAPAGAEPGGGTVTLHGYVMLYLSV